MAGLKKRVTHSVQRRLSAALCVAIFATALISGGFTFYFALDEAHELQDNTLVQLATLVTSSAGNDGAQHSVSPRPEGDNDARIIVEYLTTQVQQTPVANNTFHLRPPFKEGFQDIVTADGAWRVLVHPLTAQRWVAIAQPTSVRNEIALNSALLTLIPFAILLPILLLVTHDLIRKTFRPVVRLANDVHRRDEQCLTPLEAQGVPEEIRPFVNGINNLLNKVDVAMQNQQRFIADAAHELRTPLTALSLQAERLAASEMSSEAQSRLSALRQGLKRTHHLLEQLLALAREQQAPAESLRENVAIDALFRQVIEALLPLAADKHIDIGVVEPLPVNTQLLTDRNPLYTALKNLVENAVRYAPENGQVDLRLTQDGNKMVIEVEDNGPGIDENKLERVFDAFYRLEGTQQPGSGLGLSIVKTCVQRLGGSITLARSVHFASGLQARLTLPLVSGDIFDTEKPPLPGEKGV
ncbi:sensor histidine kinase [Yokenella regensburgei]|uniref:sensor histidine kinase n=1 Tax=Yokenella regensburgei TaxID=158877 RepID=UPI003EDAE70F